MVPVQDVVADWEINTTCNLSCRYCFIQHRRNPARSQGEIDPAGVAEGLDSTGLRWLVHITGGEPFLQPGFVEVCRALTENHRISINTNLSSPEVVSFAREVDPRGVAFVHCSLHLDQRRGETGGFAESYHLLKDRGFRVFASQVMYPGNLERFEEPLRRLGEEGVPVMAKVFRGFIGPRRYPGAYSGKERKFISGYMDSVGGEDWFGELHLNPSMDREFLDGDLSFTGLPCAAGRRFVVMSPDGEAYRCHGDKRPLGNPLRVGVELLEDDRPCPAATCPCPYHGISFSGGTGTVTRDPFLAKAKRWARFVLRRTQP